MPKHFRKIEVEENEKGCLVCVSHVPKQLGGYVKILRNGHTIKIQDHVYENCFGEIEPDKMIRQTCGDRLCMNPEHFEKIDKMPNYLGASPNRVWLTDNQITQIKIMISERDQSGLSIAQIGEKFGVSRSTIYSIKDGRFRNSIK
jgi:hypothetical protein